MDDRVADSTIGFLRSEGAAELPHGHGRTLLAHLTETYRIVRRWGQPAWLQHAALLHSAYGTDAYHRQLLPVSRRDEVIAVVGEQAERIAYLFSVIPRGPLLAGTHLWARGLPVGGATPGPEPPATPAELDALVLLHMANLAEQAQAPDGSPARWLVRLAELAELLSNSQTIEPPRFAHRLTGFSSADEGTARRAYLAGLRAGDNPQRAASRLALSAGLCPALSEPCVWLAHLSLARGDVSATGQWAALAGTRLRELGTAWDKRLDFEQWLAVAEALEQQTGSPPVPGGDPRVLHDLVMGQPGAPMPRLAPAGKERFRRYVETLAESDDQALGRTYPDLPSQPWHNAREFPLARYLESNYAAIRDEILALDPSRFQPESERISRSGDWDVVFFYERGRRRDDVCDACPVTTRGIEMHPTVRTLAGLIYLSRLRAGTHIQAHRGPTNLRVRCHLGIQVPDGDCAIRVRNESRQWTEGRCLVFDDYFEHEAWNHTEEDRIVLIVDLWHPGLSATEVSLLEGLHRYADAHAQRLNRYWSANAAAASPASRAQVPDG